MRKIISIIIIFAAFVGIFPTVGAAAKTTSSTSSNSSSSSSSSSSLSTTSTTAAATTVKVKVATPKSLSVTESLSGVTISWKRNKNVQGYVISRSTDKEQWTYLTAVVGNNNVTYVDTTARENILYYYSLKAYKTVNNINYFSAPSDALPVFFGLNLYASSYKDSVKLNWDKVDEAVGYEVYFSEDSVNFKRVKRFKKNYRVKYTQNGLEPYKKSYYFYVKVYNKIDNKRNYIYKSEILNTADILAIINGSTGTAKKKFKTSNVQGSKAYCAYKTAITEGDKNIFDDFNIKYLTDDMSPYYKIYYTFMFIHKKVTYASGNMWSLIGDSTYADAIFNKRIGQCAQYNGAMVEYLANYGINAKVIMGYRGSSVDNKWQHFWGEAKLKNGKTYVIETGNYGNDGDWYYFFKPYKQTKKYLKCGKYKSGIKA